MARRNVIAALESAQKSDAQSGQVLPPEDDQRQPSEHIPPHVFEMLQQAGEEAAQRLLELLRSPQFAKYTPAAQRSLIELALTRAYGLPVRRSVSVNLNSDDADAIAASLVTMSDKLPERDPENRQNGVGPVPYSKPPEDP